MKLTIILVVALYCATNSINAQDPNSNIQIYLDLKPEDAQQLIANQNTNLRFAPFLGTVPVARTSPEEPEKIEDVYDVSQFHGQDGLGAYLYGYSNPADSKVEDKNRNGHVRGAYNWVEPSGKVVHVKYWDTGNGFHQEDNLPKIALKPVEETPALRAARLAHEKAWKEAAEANKVSPAQYRLVYKDQNTETAQPEINRYPSYDVAASADDEVYVRPEGEDDGQWNPELYGEGGTTSEPRGFFYAFNHPAGIKYNKDEYELKHLAPHDDVASLDGPLEK